MQTGLELLCSRLGRLLLAASYWPIAKRRPRASHVVLFSINPIQRGETESTYSFVLNTLLNFDSLNAGRKNAEK
jgi:hypothetical protein